MREITTPVSEDVAKTIQIGERLLISGKIYCGRDAVLPRVCALAKTDKLREKGITLAGSAVFHTAVSAAGVGPTSSNKLEIETSIPILSQNGVKLHLGKGALSKETVRALGEYHSVYAVMPPVTALLKNNTISSRLVAYPELGMEALYELEVSGYPMIVAAAQGACIW